MPQSHNYSEIKQGMGDIPLTSWNVSNHMVSGGCDVLYQNLSGSSVTGAPKKGVGVENILLCMNDRERNKTKALGASEDIGDTVVVGEGGAIRPNWRAQTRFLMVVQA